MNAKEFKKLFIKYGMICDPENTPIPVCERCIDFEKEFNKLLESYASQQMPSEEEITKEAVRINDGNLDRYKKGMHYNSDWKAGAMWLKSLQQENQTED